MIRKTCLCLFLGAIGALLSGCPDRKPVGPSAEPITELDANVAAAIVPAAAFTIGDAETSLKFEIRPDKELLINPNISVQQTEVRTGKLASVTIDIHGPVPERLPLIVSVTSIKSFRNHTGRITGQVKIDGREFFPVRGSMGENATQTPMLGLLDVAARVDSLPETSLIVGEAELVLFRDTDPADVTEETPVPIESDRVMIYSNPVRINVHPKAAADDSVEGANN